MTTNVTEQLVADYLSRLEHAAAVLPPHRRAELLGEIRDHIDAARAAGDAGDEAAARTMLDRLGDPEEIVAAAGAELPEPSGVVTTQPGTGLELAAVLLLTVGSLIPLVLWAVGAVLLWMSRRWTTREKLVGTLVVPGGPGMALWLAAFAPGQVCTGTYDSAGNAIQETCTGFALPGWIGVPLFATILVVPFVVAGVLLSRARARAAEEPPVMRPLRSAADRTSTWSGIEVTAVLLMALGGLVVFVGILLIGAIPLVAGLVLVWVSKQWTRQHQLVGTAIVAGVPAVLMTFSALGTMEFDVERVYRALDFGLGLGAAAAAVYLAVVLNRRGAPSP